MTAPTVRRLSRRRGPRATAAGALWFFAPLVGLVAVWAVAVSASGVPMRVFPQVGDVLGALHDLWSSGDLFRHLGASLRRMGIGMALALVTALPFGIALGASRALSAFFSPLLRFSVALAGIA
ncbi:hypothetical protein ACIQFZ_37275 [Streptomyces sp. NPDC093064]|uniref:hypothetical protein n=1 Tax=unclassified Streptomyces TaxID=2593676 RepID=UPI0036B3515C